MRAAEFSEFKSFIDSKAQSFRGKVSLADLKKLWQEAQEDYHIGIEERMIQPSEEDLERIKISLKKISKQNAFQKIKPKIKYLDFRKVVSIQFNIDFDYIKRICDRINNNETYLLDLALPLSNSEQHVEINRVNNLEFIISSLNTDLRFQGLELMGENVERENESGQIGIVANIGYGIKELWCINYQGRDILFNGYHRAVALISAGITHIPVVYQSVENDDELLSLVGQIGLDACKDILSRDIIPLVSDFTVDKFVYKLDTPQPIKLIRLKIFVEEMEIKIP